VARPPITSLSLLALLALLVTSCADPSSGGGASASAIAHSTSTDDLVLRWGYEGGFTPPEYQLTNLPAFSLYGDGTIVRPGPQIEIYPGPALPALEVVRVDEAGIQAILEAAFDAGLDSIDDLTDMGSVGVADAPETVFTLRAGDVDRSVRIYALGEMGGQLPGMPDEEFEARKALLSFVDHLSSLETWLPDGSVSASAVYEVTGVRAFVTPYTVQADLPQEAIEWPLDVPLRGAGVDAGAGFRCLSVTGEDWSVLSRTVRQANQLTPWTSDGRRSAVSFRPLLPDETGC
jgi:hypothetical protein